MNNGGSHYTAPAKALHWVIAIMIFGLLCLGFYMHNLPLSPAKLKMYSWHKWAGVTLFILTVIRIAWRAGHPAPKLPLRMSRSQRSLAHGGHILLYILMFTIPLSGWLMSSAKGFKTVWFGVLPIPDLLERNKELGDLLLNIHLGLNIFLILILIGHVAAALKHHFIDRDDILVRMLP